MTTFKSVLGPDLGAMAAQYWPYAFLFCSVCMILAQIGIWKIIYNTVKQAVLMLLMSICCVICYVLVSQHLNTLSQAGTTAFLTAISDLLSGQAAKVFSNEKVVDPLTEIFITTGATLCILGMLYRQLPLSLIPDCIPCIGRYDEMLMAVVAFFGCVVLLIGVYLQYNYSQSTTSTHAFIQKTQQIVQNLQDFNWRESNTSDSWNIFYQNAQSFVYRASDIITQSVHDVYGKVQTIVNSNDTSSAQEKEL